MAQIIQFGPTGAELDLGLPGGTLHTAGTVKTVLRLTYGQPRVGGRRVSMPGVDFVALQRSGYAGETINAGGTVDAASNADLNALEVEIRKYLTDPALLGGHPLIEDVTAGGRTRSSVVLTAFQLGERSQSAGGRVVASCSLTWEVLVP